MASFLRDNDALQMNAYCDGELDPASAIEFERRLEIDDQLRARCSQLLMLRRALRALPQHEMPRELQSRIGHAVDRELPRHRKGLRQGSWSLRALVAAAMFGAILSGSVIMAIMTLGSDNSREDIAGGVVAGHIRSLLAPQPFDIASSDRHTVKPWFTTRLPASPKVVDLAPQGFILIGGRVDVVGQTPVATLVYKHAAHLVSLTALQPGQSVAPETIAGYNVRSWSNSNFTYVAVSDLSADDLATFERAFSEAR